MVKRRMAIIAVLIYFCINLLPLSVKATSTETAKQPINTEKDCSLTLSYKCDNTAFSDLEVKLYKIADISTDYQYTLTSAFEKTKLNLNGIKNNNEWKVITTTLEAYIIADGIKPDYTASTNKDGDLNFEGLKPALYLAVTERITKNDTLYSFDSALIALPNLDENGVWQYNVAVSPKSEIITPDESDKQIEFKVLKLWKGDNPETDRPPSIEIEIFCNGKSYKKVVLTKANNWTYSWSAMDDSSEWKVIERNVPSKYSMKIEERETAFIMINTLTKDTTNPPPAPQTGDTTNIMFFVILMMLSGILLIILGITGKRTQK